VTGAPGLLLVLRASGAVGPARRLAGALERRLQRGASLGALHVPELPDDASALALCGLWEPKAALERGHTPGRGAPGEKRLPENETSGRLLSSIALADETTRASVLARVRRVLRRAEVGSSCLEALELALTAGQELREPALFQDALRPGRLLVAGHRLHGRWFPDRLEADEHDLSVLGGLCALLRVLLGLHQPGAWTSLRLVRPAVGTP
jgi:hypothetical protein